MSSFTIKGLNSNGQIDDIVELKNAHGGAPLIWDTIAQKYLGLRPFGYNMETERLWPLWRDLNIPKSHRAVLAMTYDDVVVESSDFARAAEDVRLFLRDFPPSSDRVNHLEKLAEVFESAPAYEGIGFHWTSVSEDPFQGEYDEDTEEYAPHDFSNNWSLYRQLDKMDTAAA